MGSDSNAMIVATLDDIAWLLNLRGNDIQYNPLFFSYLIFHKGENDEGSRVDLFIDEVKVSEADVQEYLKANNVSVHAYTAIADKLKQYGETLQDKRIIFDEGSSNYFLFNVLKENGFEIVKRRDVIPHMKACKNAVQMEGMR